MTIANKSTSLSKTASQPAPYLRIIGLMGGFLILCLLALSVRAGEVTETAPSIDFSPDQVVRIVVESLQHNDISDAGIATVYRFAAPGNKASTGPLDRFSRMIKIGYPEMLNHRESRYDPVQISGTTAVQTVWLTNSMGKESGYAFQLGKQVVSPYAGMWMTEAVVPLGTSQGIRI